MISAQKGNSITWYPHRAPREEAKKQPPDSWSNTLPTLKRKLQNPKGPFRKATPEGRLPREQGTFCLLLTAPTLTLPALSPLGHTQGLPPPAPSFRSLPPSRRRPRQGWLLSVFRPGPRRCLCCPEVLALFLGDPRPLLELNLPCRFPATLPWGAGA